MAVDVRDPALAALTPAPPIFQQLLPTLQPPHMFPLASVLPDMKASIVGPLQMLSIQCSHS